jgi:hypothetical protein
VVAPWTRHGDIRPIVGPAPTKGQHVVSVKSAKQRFLAIGAQAALIVIHLPDNVTVDFARRCMPESPSLANSGSSLFTIAGCPLLPVARVVDSPSSLLLIDAFSVCLAPDTLLFANFLAVGTVIFSSAFVKRFVILVAPLAPSGVPTRSAFELLWFKRIKRLLFEASDTDVVTGGSQHARKHQLAQFGRCVTRLTALAKSIFRSPVAVKKLARCGPIFAALSAVLGDRIFCAQRVHSFGSCLGVPIHRRGLSMCV